MGPSPSRRRPPESLTFISIFLEGTIHEQISRSHRCRPGWACRSGPLLERGLEPVVLEAGPAVGHAIREWSHVRLFSPWEYAVDQAAVRLLEPTGWNSPDPDAYPTGGELVERYLEPLADTHGPAGHIRTTARASPVSRAQGFDKVKTSGPRRRAVRNPLSQRRRRQNGSRGRGDRRFGHLVCAKPGRRERPARDRRARRSGPHRLRHAGRARPRARPLCRQKRRSSRRWPLRRRHADRARSARPPHTRH